MAARAEIDVDGVAYSWGQIAATVRDVEATRA